MSQNLLVLFLSLALALNESSPCYLPNGEQINDRGYAPCVLSANISHCCKASDTCISNGYCFQQGGQTTDWNLRIARSSCTDRTFNSSYCPQRCKDLSTSTDMAMMLVNNSDVGEFCCSEYDAQTGLCGVPTLGSYEPFQLEPGQIIWNRNTGDADFRNIAFANVTTTAIATPRTANTTDAAGGTNIVPIVVGIAVPLGALLLLALIVAFLFWKRAKRLRLQNEQSLAEEKSSILPVAQPPATSATRHEVQALAIHEASAECQAYELKAMQDPIEIAASPIHSRR